MKDRILNLFSKIKENTSPHLKNKKPKVDLLILLVLISSVFYLSGTGRIASMNKVIGTFAQGSAEERLLPIYSVETEGNKVAISFDVAWGNSDTDELMKILRDNDVKATFFMCGYWVSTYPEDVIKIHEEGHEIANHSAGHLHLSKYPYEENKDQIMRAHQKVKDLLGVDMTLYRPPFGEYNNLILEVAEECGYYTIQWDVDSLDYLEKGTEHQLNQVLNNKNLGNGSIILFHNDTKQTPLVLDKTLKGLKEKGYEIVLISDLIHKDNYYMDHTGRQMPNSSKEESKP